MQLQSRQMASFPAWCRLDIIFPADLGLHLKSTQPVLGIIRAPSLFVNLRVLRSDQKHNRKKCNPHNLCGPGGSVVVVVVLLPNGLYHEHDT